MNIYKCLTSLLLCIALILSLTACNSTDDAYIYFNLSQKPETLDPQTAKTDTELLIVRNIFEGLMRKNQKGEIACAAAESYKKKGLTYTFYLKKDLTWSDESPITSHDFVFALQRAVNPKTKAPFAKRLSAIKNAKSILEGNMPISSLGVKALDDYTLQITLSKEDKSFLNTLTTSVAMPCNEAFFRNASGKYGLDTETTLSNGSYRLAKWGKDIFGIRLYRNDYYKGSFKASNSAIFFSASEEQSPLMALKENDADIAFIKPEQKNEAIESGLKTKSYNNITWFLTISDGFVRDMRKSFISLSSSKVFSQDLSSGCYSAKSIYPDIITDKSIHTGLTSYNVKDSKKLFAKAVENLIDKKFPTDVVLYYYDDGASKSIVTDIVAHWQSQLSAFVNIESVSSPDLLISQLKEQTYAMTIFPVIANSSNTSEYLENFGINYKGEKLKDIQSQILESKNITPLFTQDTVIAYSENLSNLNLDHGDGCIDFAYIIKDE